MIDSSSAANSSRPHGQGPTITAAIDVAVALIVHEKVILATQRGCWFGGLVYQTNVGFSSNYVLEL